MNFINLASVIELAFAVSHLLVSFPSMLDWVPKNGEQQPIHALFHQLDGLVSDIALMTSGGMLMLLLTIPQLVPEQRGRKMGSIRLFQSKFIISISR